MGTAKGDGYTVTPRDLELVVNAIGCTRLPFELDYEKLARRLGYKNAQSAKAAWNALKKKLDKVAEGAPVVPSLTIEPEPIRRIAGTPPRAESAKKKGKQPAVGPPSESSEEESGAESDEPPAPKRSKKRKQACVVDDDGDVSMAGTPKEPKAPKAKPSKSKSSSKHDKLDLGGSRRRRPAIPSSTPSDSDSDTDTPSEPEPKTPRKKLKRKITHLSVSDRAKAKDQSSTGKSARELGNEAFVAREKAFEAFGMRGAAGGKAGGGYGGDDEDEDDEEVDLPPPPYVKKEGQ